MIPATVLPRGAGVGVHEEQPIRLPRGEFLALPVTVGEGRELRAAQSPFVVVMLFPELPPVFGRPLRAKMLRERTSQRAFPGGFGPE